MIRKDYHHFKLHEAIQDVENTISAFRMNRMTKYSTEDAEFIVGHGIIRDKLMEFLNAYGLSPTIQMGNSGVILCTLE